jgi:hypothetical protein
MFVSVALACPSVILVSSGHGFPVSSPGAAAA